ncbi:precorrin-2 C(20)-methyltransferase [Pelomicrobium methylotrophicum]|uniref:Precorrin-2 C(20)-methyltransferase n=1 Tax=Pelomicrobium methylotrophicum TaxID=2602750 RepID=A0A5C7EKZ8_9PROT|nr:precorrin-2 C(20)-methyltransferase [Pelomicrobium methylotrophicum]TXF11752.1 precorrin-2 C(20)-methyltransferase [Pelomicrobium methylotrophicum]
MTSKGTLFGVSLGPGDPGLITRRAWELLHRNTVWAYPVRRKNGDSYALDIVRRSGLSLPQAHMPLVFPMTHDTEILAKYWLAAARAVLTPLYAGNDVCFLVEGDACTYSTFGHLARTVAALDGDIVIETIPGVSAYHAAAARLGTPLADGEDAVAIIPAAYGIRTIEHLLDEFDTLVLLKVKPLLDDILALLERRGLLEHARFIEKVGTPDERTIEQVAMLRGTTVNYLSLLLVKNPNRPRGELLRGCRRKSGPQAVAS